MYISTKSWSILHKFWGVNQGPREYRFMEKLNFKNLMLQSLQTDILVTQTKQCCVETFYRIDILVTQNKKQCFVDTFYLADILITQNKKQSFSIEVFLLCQKCCYLKRRLDHQKVEIFCFKEERIQRFGRFRRTV